MDSQEPRERNLTRPRLTRSEIASMLDAYPPVVTVHQAARILNLSVSTMYKHLAQGRYRTAVLRRGKPTRLIRDRLLQDFMRRR